MGYNSYFNKSNTNSKKYVTHLTEITEYSLKSCRLKKNLFMANENKRKRINNFKESKQTT